MEQEYVGQITVQDKKVPVLLSRAEAPADVAPLYLAAHATTAREIPAGALIGLDDIQGDDPALRDAWLSGLRDADVRHG